MRNDTAIDCIDPKALLHLNREGERSDLIDVSSPVEFEEVHVAFARNFPIDSPELERFMERRGRDCETPLYVMCRGGVRSVKVCTKYPEAKLVDVEGGTRNWLECGLPVTRNKAIVSLDRQVRIAAGALTAVGTALGVFVHSYFLAVPAFVGVGLVVAGVTNTCGMAMLLTKMPWNRSLRPARSQATESFSH